MNADVLTPPSPAPAGDPGHLATDAEWARIEAWAAAAADEYLRAVELDLAGDPGIDSALLAITRLDMPAKFHGGAQTPTLQVIHSAETPLSIGYAKAIGQFFEDGPAAGTSAHKMIDPATVVTMLPGPVEGFHVGPVGNLASIGYEQAGYAHFTRADWTTDLGLAQLGILAAELAADGIKYGIPDRHLTDAQLAAWHAGGRRRQDGGRCTHLQIERVLGGTTHTDPETNYPLDLLNAAVTQARAGSPDPEDDWMSLFATVADFKAAVTAATTDALNAGTPVGQASWAAGNRAILGTVQQIVNLEGHEDADVQAVGAAVADTKSAVLGALAALPTAHLSDDDKTALAQDVVSLINAAGIELAPAEVTAIGAAVGVDLAARLAS